jgi:hypothetical protein
MYVDETVLNFMGGKEIESALMENETIDGHSGIYRPLWIYQDFRKRKSQYGGQLTE